MADKLTDAIDKELHPLAIKKAEEYINEFSTSLILQAKIHAFRRRAELVLCNDIEEAYDLISKGKTQHWGKQLSMVVGSAFFGVFVQGFATELFTGNSLMIAIYTSLGFVGITAVFYGLRQ